MLKTKAFKLVFVGMLSGISYLLMALNFPLPGLPAFLKIDFSEIPAMLATILLGPIAGLAVEAIKNTLHYIIQGSTTGVPIDQLANFLAGLFFLLPFAFVFQKIRSMKGVLFGLAAGTISMSVAMSLLNYYFILPAYTLFLNMPQMSIAEVKQVIIAGILPFNLIKGTIIAIVFLMIYGRIKEWLQHKFNVQNA